MKAGLCVRTFFVFFCCVSRWVFFSKDEVLAASTGVILALSFFLNNTVAALVRGKREY